MGKNNKMIHKQKLRKKSMKNKFRIFNEKNTHTHTPATKRYKRKYKTENDFLDAI